MIDPALIPFIQRLDKDPEDDEALEAIREGLARRGEVSTFAMLSEKVAARRSDPQRSAEAQHRAAEAWVETGREDRAIPLWRQVLEADPQHIGASLGLARAWRRAGKLDQAEGAYARLLQTVRGGARRVPILQDVAALRAERGDLDGEISAMREVVELLGAGAGATEPRRTLARLLVQRTRARTQGKSELEEAYDDDTREAARTLASIAREGVTGRSMDFAQAALALWPGEERAFQMVLAGTLKHAESVTLRIRFLAANPESAIAARVRGELADAYVSTGRVDDAVAVLAASATEDPESARQLTRLYERTGRHADLARLLASVPTPTDRRERLVLHRKRAAVARTLGNRAGVIENLRRVLDDAPADPEALPEVERDLRVHGALEELRDRLRAAAMAEGADAPSRVRWWREVAQLSERRFDAPEDALTAWRAVLSDAEEREDLEAAREGVERALERLERWSELADARAVAARAAQGEGATRDAWLRWWEVAQAHVSPQDALRGLDEALRAAPCDALRAALVQARRSAGDDAGVTSALRARAEASAGDERASAWCALAEHLERAGDTAEALDAWRKTHALDPAREDAWRAEARIHESRGDRESLLETLVAQANHPTAAGRSAGALYGRAMTVAFTLGRDEEARALAERALRFNPDDDAARETLAALRGEDTAPVPLAQEAPSATDPPASQGISSILPDADDSATPTLEPPEPAVEAQPAPAEQTSPHRAPDHVAPLAPPTAARAPVVVPDEPTPAPLVLPDEPAPVVLPDEPAPVVVPDEPTPRPTPIADEPTPVIAHERPAPRPPAKAHDARDDDPAEATASHDTLDAEEATSAHSVVSDGDEDSGPTGIMSRAALNQAMQEAERVEREASARTEPATPPVILRASVPPPPPPRPAPPLPPRPLPRVPPPPPVPARSAPPPPRSVPPPPPPPVVETAAPSLRAEAEVAAPKGEEEPSIIIDDGLMAGPTMPRPPESPVLPPHASHAPFAPHPPQPTAPPPPSLQPLAMNPLPPPAQSLQPLAMNPLPQLTPSLQPLAMNPLPPPAQSLQPLAMGAAPLAPLSLHAPPPPALPSLELRSATQPLSSLTFDEPAPEGDPFDDPFASRSDDPFASRSDDPFASAPAAAPPLAPPTPPAQTAFARPMLSMLERALGYRGG